MAEQIKKDLAEDPKKHHELPDEKTIHEAGELEIQDESGTSMPFRTLYTSSAKGSTKHLIVFIRHFYCGHCEDYVRALSTAFPSPQNHTPSFTLTVIGCGQPHVIPEYRTRTSCPFPIYTDPSRAIYAKLGMVINLDLGDKKPEYVESGIVRGTLSSMWNMIKSGAVNGKGGAYDQNGGEWIFEEEELRWCHRMENTRDHAEIGEVEGVLGVV
ncbi:Uu.00g030100.m01.CDS01 [Anthostomella pinea]|uniref:Uu.00g030100.m01.CDS01 n=1 Tax=Anthostomella pinea TaxID=933095 RepID=A0AAI8V8U3_9PEZI|nr:Uu.00g030100.m01.CDS01 [Anthostomella pinea]